MIPGRAGIIVLAFTIADLTVECPFLVIAHYITY
jgi:hypothetical protein